MGETVVVLPLSCARLRAISEFIARSLAAQPGGSLQRLVDGPYLGSAFYATDITYDLLQNCNRWTAAALRSGGFAVAPDGVILLKPSDEPGSGDSGAERQSQARGCCCQPMHILNQTSSLLHATQL